MKKDIDKSSVKELQDKIAELLKRTQSSSSYTYLDCVSRGTPQVNFTYTKPKP